MNLFRIVRKRTNKRNREGSHCRDVSTVLLFVFLLPYVISCLWGHVGEETEPFFQKSEETDWIDERYEVTFPVSWGTRQMSMQEYLVQKLKMVMPADEDGGVLYELETLKAQAVLLRTELWSLFLSGEKAIVLQDDVTMYYEAEDVTDETETLYEKAVQETDGIFLAYEGMPVKAAYFPVSNGQTRNAAEVWSDNSYPYLLSIECSQDILAKDYQSRVTITKEEYCRLVRELFEIDKTESELWESPKFTYDSTGYVVKVEFQGSICSGETFRYAFGLNSSSFTAQWQEDTVDFHVKGVGHGFGMSQYGANEKAVAGQTFEQILKDYFFQTELEKIE